MECGFDIRAAAGVEPRWRGVPILNGSESADYVYNPIVTVYIVIGRLFHDHDNRAFNGELKMLGFGEL